MNVFYVLGVVLVVWAIVVSVLGLRRPEFPGNSGGERIVIAISALLVVATIAAGILASAAEEDGGETAGRLPPVATAR